MVPFAGEEGTEAASGGVAAQRGGAQVGQQLMNDLDPKARVSVQRPALLGRTMKTYPNQDTTVPKKTITQNHVLEMCINYDFLFTFYKQ